MLGIGINGDFRAYPLQILLWHEIVNDVVGGVPVLVSYCPLCNSGVVFDRRVGGRVLEFGNTGRIRHFDMVMYDTENREWWQQFLGEAIMGELTGTRLKALPARLESLERFSERAPGGKVLVPDDAAARPYGATPYSGMDSARCRRDGSPTPCPRASRRYRVSSSSATRPGPWPWCAATGARRPAPGHRLGGGPELHPRPADHRLGPRRRNVTVRRRTAAGLEDVAYDVSFAFAFAAFVPGGPIQHRE